MKCCSLLLFALFLCVLQPPSIFAITDEETEKKQQDYMMYMKDAYEKFKEKKATEEEKDKEKDKDKKKLDKEESSAKAQTPLTNATKDEKQLTTNLFKDATYDKFSNQTAKNTPFNKSDIRE